MFHYLKIDPYYFELQRQGIKNYEVRYNDRDYSAGDILVLEEYDVTESGYTGRQWAVSVDSVLKNLSGLAKGYCVMSTRKAVWQRDPTTGRIEKGAFGNISTGKATPSKTKSPTSETPPFFAVISMK